jgi:hypothetical protein
MKQDFYMGTYFEKEYLMQKVGDDWMILGNSGYLVHKSVVIDTRKITVVDTHPDIVFRVANHVLSYNSLAKTPVPGVSEDAIEILHQIDRPVKNEVGKPCVIEPLGLGAVVEFEGQVYKKRYKVVRQYDGEWRAKGSNRFTWKYMLLGDPILLSEGVE